MRTVLLSLLVTLCVTHAQSQVPSPESFFGFSVGERHLRPDQIVEYLNVLAASSDRIKIEQNRRDSLTLRRPYAEESRYAGGSISMARSSR